MLSLKVSQVNNGASFWDWLKHFFLSKRAQFIKNTSEKRLSLGKLTISAIIAEKKYRHKIIT